MPYKQFQNVDFKDGYRRTYENQKNDVELSRKMIKQIRKEIAKYKNNSSNNN